MRKVFVEPEVHRIELNLHENIAASIQITMGYLFQVDLFGCPIVSTEKIFPNFTEKDAEICAATSYARSLMRFYPREEVIPYFKH